MGLLKILAVTLSFYISPYEADSTGCGEDLARIEKVAAIRLFGAPRYFYGHPWLIRQRPAVSGFDTLQVEDSGGWSYWVAAVDSAGNQTPLNCAPGITVGVPSVGVDNPSGQPGRKWEWLDSQGRRLPTIPTKRGVYWKREVGKRKSVKIVVL